MMVRDRLVTITRAGQPANTHRKPRITITARVSGAAKLPRLLPPGEEVGKSKRQLSARSRDLTSAVLQRGLREGSSARGCYTFSRIRPTLFSSLIFSRLFFLSEISFLTARRAISVWSRDFIKIMKEKENKKWRARACYIKSVLYASDLCPWFMSV